MISKKNVLSLVSSSLVGACITEYVSGRRLRKIIRNKEDNEKKQNEFYFIMLQWIRIHQEGRSLANYFEKKKYKTVAIYGMKELGEALLRELTNTDIVVKYGIDRDADNIYVGLDVIRPDEELSEVDVVVVTAVHYFNAIEEELSQRLDAKIVSLEDIVWEA